ncbi:hemolysin-III family protein [Mollisia scopiformis]|uniref:Hemolysin-III family protein n=1 Tax=Mollisia scopiformis TaxID=149040 RepID=A0A194X1Z9_MOLSC|nr:hemolysin-III family protein [Mollisia scopiformis]KUJ14220.1 hemolysin-III family protein [Mollisia scopiformis]
MESLSRQRKQPTPVQMEVVPLTSNFESTHPALLSYDEIPEWYQDNDFIRHGYRPESNSVRACFASWLYMHNETVNIHSHFIPGILFLAAEVGIHQYLQTKYPKATIGDRLIFAFFLLTAVTCLGMSAAYHTLMNHSNHVSHLWLRLDFVGIAILTLGDFVSGIYMVFYCEPVLQRIYWIMIITLSFATIFILLNPRFQGRRWRTFRVCTFVGTGLSGLAPLAHGVKIFGFSQMGKQSGMAYYVGEGLLLMLGALFYTVSIEIMCSSPYVNTCCL